MFFSRIYYLCVMNRVLISLSLVLAVVLAVFTGCEEVPPFIDFSSEAKSKDTSYIVSTVPDPQHKVVLIEDITGVRCVNCPTAAQKIRDIITAKSEDSVIGMALYPWPTNTNSLFNNTAPYDGFPLLANEISSQIVEGLGIPQGLPSGYVDRNIFAPQTVRYQAVGTWSTLVNQRLKLKTPVNITLQKSVSGNKLGVDVKLQYTEAVSGNHKFALYLVEDDIVSKQASTSGTIDTYVHNHALRHTFTLAMGQPLSETLVPGRTFDKHYEYELPSVNKMVNCSVICIIISETTGEVVNARKIALK
jgi:hypothetical protein